jgi:YcxB-like protein
MAKHTIQYTTTKAHLVYFSFVHTLRQNAVRIMFAMPIIFLAWRVAVLANSRKLPLYLTIAIVAAAILGTIVFILCLHLAMTLLLFKGRGKDSGVLTAHTITLTEDGINEVTATGHSDQNWKSIVEVIRSRNFILIYTQRHAAHVIPLSAFASREAADEFYDFALSAFKKS